MRECLDCGQRMTADAEWWWGLPAVERDQRRAEGLTLHKARGLCHPCYNRARRQGTRDKFARLSADWTKPAPVKRDDLEACGRCERGIIPSTEWRTASPEQRDAWRTEGMARHEARGLCQPCYRLVRIADRLVNYERRNIPTAEVLEEWEWMADPLRPLNEEIRRLAPRFGMSEDALAGALQRGGVRSRFKGGWGERVKGVAA